MFWARLRLILARAARLTTTQILGACLDSHLKNTSSIAPYLQLQLDSCVVV